MEASRPVHGMRWCRSLRIGSMRAPTISRCPPPIFCLGDNILALPLLWLLFLLVQHLRPSLMGREGKLFHTLEPKHQPLSWQLPHAQNRRRRFYRNTEFYVRGTHINLKRTTYTCPATYAPSFSDSSNKKFLVGGRRRDEWNEESPE